MLLLLADRFLHTTPSINTPVGRTVDCTSLRESNSMYVFDCTFQLILVCGRAGLGRHVAIPRYARPSLPAEGAGIRESLGIGGVVVG